MNSEKVISQEKTRYFLTFFLLAFGFMTYEISVLRELRFQILNHFIVTPFLFSSVLFLIGLGSLSVSLWRPNSQRILKICLLLLPVLTGPAFLGLMKGAQMVKTPMTGELFFVGAKSFSLGHLMKEIVYSFLIVIPFGYGIVFFLQGIIFALFLQIGREERFLPRLYAADLIASGVGAILAGTIAFLLDPIQGILFSIFLFTLVPWISRNLFQYSKGVCIGLSFVVSLLFVAEGCFHILKRNETPSWLRQDSLFSEWTPYQRIDLIDKERNIDVYVDGWLYFNVSKPQFLTRDHNAPTFLVDLINEPLFSSRDILVIGAGTGNDLQYIRRLSKRNPHVTAIELDRGHIHAAKSIPWLWESYGSVQIVTGEARYYLETVDKKYDLIFYAAADPRAMVSSLAIPDANLLYSDRALSKAYERLKTGGMIYIARWAGDESFFTATLCATLKTAGIQKEEALLFKTRSAAFIPTGGRIGIFAFVHKGPFPEQRRHWLRKEASEFGWVEIPWISSDVRPTTDDHPFVQGGVPLFQILFRYAELFRWLQWLIVGFAILLGLRLASSLAHSHFFILGLSWMLVESIILFHSFLLIGNPALSAALSLGIFLLSNGVGSLLSERWQRRKEFLFLIPASVLCYTLLVLVLGRYAFSVPVFLRVFVFTLFILPVGLATGTLFPISLSIFKNAAVSKMYFIDLVGGAMAPLVFWSVFSAYGLQVVAAACIFGYLVAAIILHEVS